jgi:Domain of unknown function (DUF4397)
MDLRSAKPAARPGAKLRDARHLLAVAVLAALLAVVAAPLQARADMPATGKAQVRLVDLSSDSQMDDFYVDGVRCWAAVAYKTVSNYIEVNPGPHTYEIRKAGSDATSVPLATTRQNAEANSFYSVLAGGWADSLRINVYPDGSSSMPTSEVCQARFINASPDLKSIDFAVHGLDANFLKLGFMESSKYGQLPKGVYDVEMRDSRSLNVIATVKNFVAPGGHMHTLVAAGGMGQPVELVEFYDAMTADQVPAGAAHTGMGGGNLRSTTLSALPILPFALIGSVLLLAGLPRLKP